MIRKLFVLSILLIGYASAQNIEEFLRRLKDERRFEDENPCAGYEGRLFVRNTRGCAWYHECNAEGQAVRQGRCDEGFWFNHDEELCDHTVNVKCDYDDRLNNLNCPVGGGVTVIPHKYSCSKYIVCFNGIENDRDCPAGLHFSYYDNDCVDPYYADCHLDRGLCSESIGSVAPVFVPNTRDCQSYYLCVGGTAVSLRCRTGQHFNPRENWCDDMDVAQCTPVIPPNNPVIPEKISIDCEGASGVAIPHPDSCEFYFFCAGDRSYLQSCNPELVFDTKTNRCQVKETATCILDETEPAPEEDSRRQNVLRRLSNL